MLGILISIFGLGFLILAHEFGHFVVAKVTGMRVEEFSIGFGPYLVSRRMGDTIYGISAVPLGGYVRVTGMHEEEFQARVDAVREEREHRVRDPESRLTGSSAIADEEVIRTPLNRRYYARPVWQRILFIVAGVSMNMVVAFLLLYVVAFQGYFEASTVIEEVVEGSPAAEAGIRPGDQILSVAGEEVDNWAGAQQTIRLHEGEQVPITIERSGQVQDLQTTLEDRDGVGFLGVAPETERVEPGIFGAFSFAASRTWDMFTVVFVLIGDMFSGDVPVTGDQGLAGPVGIVSISSEAVSSGIFLSLLAFISVQLAILNMIPLLPLDGGHVLFSLLEKVLGRAVSLRTFERVSMVGITLFLLLFLVATTNDLGRLFGGGGPSF